jgi:opacity protein-like surface antigen
MKSQIQFLLAVGILSLARVSQAQAVSKSAVPDVLKGFYLSTDMGLAFQQPIYVIGADQIKFNDGIRGDLSAGYRFTPWCAAELAGGVVWNRAHAIGGVPLSNYDGSMDLYEIPMMANIVFTLPLKHGFKLDFGGGVGAVAGILHFNNPLGDIHDTDFTFAYQFSTGLNYKLTENIELGLGFKFLQTNNHFWSENGVSLNTEGTATYSLTASLSWSF